MEPSSGCQARSSRESWRVRLRLTNVETRFLANRLSRSRRGEEGEFHHGGHGGTEGGEQGRYGGERKADKESRQRKAGRRSQEGEYHHGEDGEHSGRRGRERKAG
jgi:hypothetical protein